MGLFHDYRLIFDQEANQTRWRWGEGRLRRLGFFVLTIILCAIAFAAGKYRSTPNIPLTTEHFVFEYDASFQDQNSPLTDGNWHGLFPGRKGFFSHPTFAPQRSAFAVFHQLHCLNSIRKSYWELYDIASNNEAFPGDQNLQGMSAPSHMRHCIELLRHALMCQPDLTVELKINGGVTGFGAEHECKSWDDLIEWTGRLESYGFNSSLEH